MIRPFFLALLAVAGMTVAASAREIYYPGVDQPPLGGTHWTFGPALVYGGSHPDAHAIPSNFNAWNADTRPPLVLPAPLTPRVSGFRGLFQRFRSAAPAPHHQYHAPPAHWHSNRFGY
jgi:hypothetical protein